MPKANPRKIVNAGALIGRAFSMRELLALASAVNTARGAVDVRDLKTLNLASAKLRKGYDWKHYTRPHGAGATASEDGRPKSR
jgi:hypothetical protein